MTEDDFCNFVWRLYQNIRHWAASQGVEDSKLVDYLSLSNILVVQKSPTIGRLVHVTVKSPMYFEVVSWLIGLLTNPPVFTIPPHIGPSRIQSIKINEDSIYLCHILILELDYFGKIKWLVFKRKGKNFSGDYI